YPVGQSLASLDLDQSATGRMLIDYVLKRGHERIAVLMRQRRGYGDDVMLDHITAGAMAARLKPGNLLVRSVPLDADSALLTVRELLRHEIRPTAVIVRPSVALPALRQAADELGLTIGKNLLVIVGGDLPATAEEGEQRLPYIQSELNAEQEGRIVGRLLTELASGQTPNPLHVVVPPLLREPEGD
ncbi:MAG: substrate-binding domain-containing protein, partial [Phycisphaeraceae bacterium]|nr:substrate-binding domain-containing protein [Phycisphaeraceae bacterium]